MQTCSDILKKAGVYPLLKLAVKNDKGAIVSTGPHKVVMISDKAVEKRVDIMATQKTPHIELTLEENGEKKSYYFPVHEDEENIKGVHYLVKRFGQISPGDILIMECKRRGNHNYIDVKKVNEEGEEIIDEEPEELPEIKKDDIPVVEEEEEPSKEQIEEVFGPEKE